MRQGSGGSHLARLLGVLGARRGSTTATSSSLSSSTEDWSQSFHVLPPVRYEEGSPAPTALQWLRRRGPHMSEGALRKLTRARRIRVAEGGALRRVSPSALLPPGARLLIPKHAAAPQAAPARQPQSPHVAKLQAQLAAIMQRRVLHMEPDFMVLDKPAGLPVQGGDGINVSVDSLLPHLHFDAPDRPRLVHRLDRNTSGALIIARTADAATWLSEALRRPAQQLSGASSRGHAPLHAGTVVEKYYQALVEDSPNLADEGTIEGMLTGGGSSANRRAPAGQPARTRYRVLKRSREEFALLELQPVTGRKHQLRIQCAELGAPIVGDARYGRTRSPAQLSLARVGGLGDGVSSRSVCPTETALAKLLGCTTPLQLHCSRVVVQKNPRHRVEVHAPPPLHMRSAVRAAFHPGLAEPPGKTEVAGTHLPTTADVATAEATDSKEAGPSEQQDLHSGNAVGEHKGLAESEPGFRSEQIHSATGVVLANWGEEAVVQSNNSLKGRWSWQRKMEARAARAAGADTRREKKRAKTARKGRKGTRRAAAERHTIAAVRI